MTLLFNIDNQRIITANTRYVVADSREYLTARFVFSGDWDGCAKTAIFAGKEGTYEVLLTNDECTVPHEVLNGRFGVSVFGISGNTRITTDTVYIAVQKSGFTEGETPADPTPTVYEQLLKAIDESGQDSKAAIEKESETRAAADAELKENKADKTALNDYYTKTETDELIDAATGEMPLDSYYTKTETDGLLSDKADVSALTSEAQARAAADEALEQSKADKTAFGDYYTKAETDDLISDKADVSALQNYYTKTEADGLLDDKADTSAVSSETAARIAADEALDESKADKTELDSYYTKTEADGLLNGKADTSALGGYYTKAQTDDMLDGKADTSALGSYYTKDEVDYTVNTLQDGISEKIAKMQLINNPLAPSVSKTAQQVLTDSVYTNSQFSSVSQKATEALEGLEDKADIPAITTPTGTSVTLSDNTEARFGEVATLTLSLPSDTSGDYISSVIFTAGTTATSLSYPDTITMIGTDCIDGVFAPVANKRYTVIVAYDGAGLVGYVAGHEVTA